MTSGSEGASRLPGCDQVQREVAGEVAADRDASDAVASFVESSGEKTPMPSLPGKNRNHAT